jgi:hypothetical protein
MAIFLAAIALGGCVTVFDDAALASSMSQARVAPDIYRITSSIEAVDEPGRARDFALLRAARLAIANHFRYFAVLPTTGRAAGLVIHIFADPPEGAITYDAVVLVAALKDKYHLD